eukprot:scaffold25098_cov64-Cyclotella_meneghiniana.AAC.9
MAMQYTQQLDILVQLMDKVDVKPKQILAQAQAAFDEALRVFPDETLPHAHALFAQLCVRIQNYEKSLKLFDEAIRRASIPLEDYHDSLKGDNNRDDDDDDDDSLQQQQTPPEIEEAEALVKQLILERNRAHFHHLQFSIDKWDNANNALHGGGIPPETSPKDPLSVVEHQLKVFPNPHPQSLFDKATFMVLLLDSPSDDESLNRTAKALEAYDVYTKAQTWAFGAYTHGKKRGLAGGKACSGNDAGFGVAVGGTGWQNFALESYPFQSTTHNNGKSKTFMGIVAFQNVIVSGKDAVISGYGDNCRVFVPHRYVNLADNIPLVSSWESSVNELTMGDNPMWMTYIPSNDHKAYGGSIGKDANGNQILHIPDPKPRSTSRGFDSAVLLTGYASDNYYHFVSETLPALVMMKERIEDVLTKTNIDSKGKTKDVIIVPSLQKEFVNGFLRLLLPNAFVNETIAQHLIPWGTSRGNANATSKFLTPHPMTYVRRLFAAVWDQPNEAPPPVPGIAHCLTPSPLLIAMRQAVWSAVDGLRGELDKEDTKVKVVYCPRTSSATRTLRDEVILLSKLNEIVSELGAEVAVFEKANSTLSHQSTLESVMESVELFRSASVIVGVHGASLANIAFSKPGVTVIEMGFEGLPQASHYRHLSNALGLQHVDVWLERDHRSLGATQVRLRPEGMQEVINAVVNVVNVALAALKLNFFASVTTQLKLSCKHPSSANKTIIN